MRAKLYLILRIGVSLGLIAFLLWSMRDQFPVISGTLAQANLHLFFLAATLFVLAITVLAFRLQLIFVGEGLSVPYGKTVQLSYIGYFFNNFMPTAVGGDVVKAYYTYKQTNEAAKSFIAVFMDRFIGLFSFAFIALIALAFSWDNIDNTLKITVIAFSVMCVVLIILIGNKKITDIVVRALSRLKLWNAGEKLSKVYRAVHEYGNKRKMLLVVFIVSVISQSIYFFIVGLLVKSLDAHVPLYTVFIIMPIVSVVSMLPSMGGLGIREGAIVTLFGSVIGNDKAFSLSILLLASLLILSLVGAAIYVGARQFRTTRVDVHGLEKYTL